MARYIATIDCGSSNVRCILFDMDTGRQVSVAARDWYVPQDDTVPGAYRFTDQDNWPLVCQCTQAALRRVNPKDVVAVTASGFRHGIFALDKDTGEILYGSFNMDSRIDSASTLPIAEDVFRCTGDWPTLHGLPRLMWLKHNDPAAFDRVGAFMCVADWVAYKLCGEQTMEVGNASSTVMLDVLTRQWSREILDKTGISPDICPKVVDAGTVLGTVGQTIAQQTGFLPGTTVVCGVADTQAGLVGVGAVGAGTSAIVGGTYWLDCHITDQPVVDPDFRTRLSCHSEKGQWVYEGVGFCVGLAVRWFRDVFGQEEKRIAAQYGLNAYDLLSQLTLDVPAGSYGMQVLLSDVANQKDWRMAAPTFMDWDILAPEKSHKGVFFKALLENICYTAWGEYANIRRILKDDALPREIILSGGAAHSPVWCQILSDVMGVPVHTPQEREGTAIGAAIYAAVGCGLYGSTAEAVGALIHRDRVYEPDRNHHEIYMDAYRRWRKLYENGLGLLEQGLVKSMWQADSTLSPTQIANPWKL